MIRENALIRRCSLAIREVTVPSRSLPASFTYLLCSQVCEART